MSAKNKTKTSTFLAICLFCAGVALSLGAYAYTCQQQCQAAYVNASKAEPCRCTNASRSTTPA